jgi:pimeloyl-ACP methyl ester carboxylesterase/DNA-binding SARP family transcriptional activator
VPALAVRLLGPLEVTVDRRALGPGDFGGQVPKRVLEVLLCHQGDAVPKDRLIDLVWGDATPRRAMAALENYVSVLRHRISDDAAVARDLLVTVPGAYRVKLDDGSLDIWRFDQLVAGAATQPAGARHGMLAEAVGLARGELLADEPYADFAAGLRALYDERVRQARLDGAEDLLAVGRFREAAGWAEHALDTDGIAERGYRILILAHYALGEQGAALHAYDRCRAGLRDAIGASPLPETEALYLAVLNHVPASELLESSTAPEIGGPGPTSAGGGPAHPITRYASHHGTHLAYQVIGDGPRDLVFMPGSFTNVEVGWEEPRYAAFLTRLAEQRRLLLFDKSGMGMSDPASPDDSVEQRAGEIGAVMDAVGSERAVLFGVSEGAPLAVAFSVAYPERVDGLVLYAGFARLGNTAEYDLGWAPEFVQMFLDGIDTLWRTGRGGEVANPTVSGDAPYAEWIARYFRLAASPATARATIEYFSKLDVRPALARVEAPTLVIHRADEKWVPPACGRYVAEGIPNSRYLEVPGRDHWPWIGDADAVLAPALAFIDSLTRPNTPPPPA